MRWFANANIAVIRDTSLSCQTPDVLTQKMADLLFALIMAASRRLVEPSNHVDDGH